MVGGDTTNNNTDLILKIKIILKKIKKSTNGILLSIQ